MNNRIRKLYSSQSELTLIQDSILDMERGWCTMLSLVNLWPFILFYFLIYILLPCNYCSRRQSLRCVNDVDLVRKNGMISSLFLFIKETALLMYIVTVIMVWRHSCGRTTQCNFSMIAQSSFRMVKSFRYFKKKNKNRMLHTVLLSNYISVKYIINPSGWYISGYGELSPHLSHQQSVL